MDGLVVDPVVGNALLIAARSVVGLVLVAAGFAKLHAGTAAFALAVLGYDLLPARSVLVLARLVPRVEIATGALLIAGLGTAYAAALAGSLLGVFSLAIASGLLRRRSNDCGCGGDRRPIGWRLVERNVALLLLVLPPLRDGAGTWSLDAIVLRSPPVQVDGPSVLAAIASLAALYALNAGHVLGPAAWSARSSELSAVPVERTILRVNKEGGS